MVVFLARMTITDQNKSSLSGAKRSKNLLLKAKFGDKSVVLFDVGSLEIGKEILSSCNLDVHTTLGGIVMLVESHVDSQLLDLLGEDGDLNFDRTGVLLISAAILDNLCLLFLCKSHFLLPHFSFSSLPVVGELEDRAYYQKKG
jgi:hypothetical protein